MMSKSERLTVLSEAEQFALYGMPDFDDGQQLEYLSLSETELVLACSRPGLHAKAYCALQIGYFKAKHAFFRFTWDNAQDDCTFVLTRYLRVGRDSDGTRQLCKYSASLTPPQIQRVFS